MDCFYATAGHTRLYEWKQQAQVHGNAAQLEWKIPPVVLPAVDNIIQESLLINLTDSQNQAAGWQHLRMCAARSFHARKMAARIPAPPKTRWKPEYGTGVLMGHDDIWNRAFIMVLIDSASCGNDYTTYADA